MLIRTVVATTIQKYFFINNTTREFFLASNLECPLLVLEHQPCGSGKWLEKKMLISINKNLIKFLVALEFLRWIIFQFEKSSPIHILAEFIL